MSLQRQHYYAPISRIASHQIGDWLSSDCVINDYQKILMVKKVIFVIQIANSLLIHSVFAYLPISQF
jgi:hypothetical protein